MRSFAHMILPDIYRDSWSCNHDCGCDPLSKWRLQERAFTVIELSVTIMIMAVITALLFPALRNAQAQSDMAICTSNLRKIGVALLTYAAENGGVFPASENTDPKYAGTQCKHWSYTIWTYVGYSASSFRYPDNDLQGNSGEDRNMFHCPATKRQSVRKFQEIQTPNANSSAGNRFSYALNTGPVNNSAITAIRSMQIANSSATAMVLEQNENPSNRFLFHNFYGLLPHSKKCNILFFDGHVSLMPYTDIPPVSQASASFWSGQ